MDTERAKQRDLALATARADRISENQNLVWLFGQDLTSAMLDYAEGSLRLPFDHSIQVGIGPSCQPENRLELVTKLSKLLDDPQTRSLAIDAFFQTVELLVNQRVQESQSWDSLPSAD